MLKNWFSRPGIWISAPLIPVLFLVSSKPREAICPALTLFFSIPVICIATQTLIYGASSSPVSIICGAFPLQFQLDALSSVFLALLALVSIAISLFSTGYLRHLGRSIHLGHYWLWFCFFLVSMALVIVSSDAITFFVCWEVMSVSSGLLVATEYTKHKVQRAALIYLGSTRIAGVFLAGGFLWMHALTNSWRFVDWRFDLPESYIPASLILLGFLIKAGSWPFHIWLPYAHPAAPTTVSALMSGVMIKIALYGAIRVLVLGQLNCLAIILGILFLGTVSMFWGVLFALVQTDIKRILAYSSVENIGIVLIGISVCMLARISDLPEIAAIALAAAVFHSFAHGLFKSLLFLGAGTINTVTQTRDLSQLGGLAKNLPWTMPCFLSGCIAICALPPVNGFVSKWMTYQSLLHMTWQSSDLLQRSACLALICLLSVVGGLSLACFANTFGVAFLGKARSKQASEAHEGDVGMIASQIFLVVCCVGMGVFAQSFLAILEPICTQVTGIDSHVGRAYDVPLATVAIASLSLVFVLYALIIRTSQVRRYITWECGFGNLSSRTQITPMSFAQPLARIFSPILRYKIVCDIQGEDRRHFPQRIEVEPHMVSILEQRFYRPLIAGVNFLARGIAKLQTGSIHLYLAYLCVTLVVLLIVGTRL